MTLSANPAKLLPSQLTADGYDEFLAAVGRVFFTALADNKFLFQTDASNLWSLYLTGASDTELRERNCRCCKTFIERFGGLVLIDSKGKLKSALWNIEAPEAYRSAAKHLATTVEQSKVTGVFVSSESMLGSQYTGQWQHVAVDWPQSHRHNSPLTSASQVAAQRRQDFDMLLRGLADFPLPVVKTAHSHLSTGALFRSEKCEGVAQWLMALHEDRQSTKNEHAQNNITWKAVASAPAGFCHVRSGMIGTLLEDLVAELPFETLKARFEAKMSPTQYLRPQAAPTEQNIAQAEKMLATLRAAGALERRFAKLDDVQTYWLSPAWREHANATHGPTNQAEATKGIFAHLRTKPTIKVETSGAPPVVMTWVKFASTVLTTADRLELFVPEAKRSYGAFVTAKNPEAPPLLQWDSTDKRNTASMYLYVSGSLPHAWNLKAGEFHEVTALVEAPSMWNKARPMSHQGNSVCVVLKGAYDTAHEAGGGMFPESMKSEFHSIRRTLEAYFKTATIEDKTEAEVCGLFLSKGSNWDSEFAVTHNGLRVRYRLDRWD
jgi:hypothetical protein